MKPKKSALSEQKGIEPPASVSASAVEKIKALRKNKVDATALANQICKGDMVALSKAITYVESTNPAHTAIANTIIAACLPHANTSVRIGITGVPGVGKSTFIEAFGKELTRIGEKVAVLAVDPSSSVSGGSILGDKTRMEDLVKDKNAFIRPSPSGDSLGGVARKTRESIILCEACGFNTIIIETVGVGQSETAVHSMVDFFLLLKLAGAGDELQGIKRGIMEMADAIVINKADGENTKPAEKARVEFLRALHLYPQKASGWRPKVLTASALHSLGVEAVWQMVEEYINQVKINNYFEEHRIIQQKFWFKQTIDDRLKNHFYQNIEVKNALKKYNTMLDNNHITPFVAAEELLRLYLQS